MTSNLDHLKLIEKVQKTSYILYEDTPLFNMEPHFFAVFFLFFFSFILAYLEYFHTGSIRERLRAGGKEGERGGDGWMASLTQYT